MPRRNSANYYHTGLSLALVALIFGTVGILMLFLAKAASNGASIEPEQGSLSGNSRVVTDSAASSGSSVQFFAQASSWDPHATLAPGSALPDDAACRTRITPAAEIRPQLAGRNATAGHQNNLPGLKARVTGNFTGTTDEILQWVACKWGVDVDIVRAQAAKESWWSFAKGDWTTNASACPPAHPLGADGTAGQCPESYGILQVRYLYHGPPAGLNTWPDVENSTAYNADYTYSVWRECFEGYYGWFNDVEHTGTYAAGDAWGCIGSWFAGRWRTDAANGYIQSVQDYKNQRIWTSPDFANFRG